MGYPFYGGSGSASPYPHSLINGGAAAAAVSCEQLRFTIYLPLFN